MLARRLSFAHLARPATMTAAPASRRCDTCPTRDWRRIAVADGYLRLSLTLPGGQAFRWRDVGPVHWAAQESVYHEWAGVLADHLVVLRQRSEEPAPDTPESVYFRLASDGKLDEVEPILRDYLQSDLDMWPMVEGFCEADEKFAKVFPHYRGARMLRQEPVECFFAFICSSNNNIKRITMMVHHLARAYGEEVGEHSGEKYYAFPTVETLAEHAREDDLRSAGFGYRAKFIVASAKKLVAISSKLGLTAEQYLLSLRERPRTEVSEALTQFSGIGRKVAGCIALMSIDQPGEIPVDTHVWKIAIHYMPALKAKTLTPRVYDAVGDFFRERFGEFAGIAHNWLFIAELGDFKHRAEGGEGKKEKLKKTKKRKVEPTVADGKVGDVKPRLRVKREAVVKKEEERVVEVKEEPTFANVRKKKPRSRAERRVNKNAPTANGTE